MILFCSSIMPLCGERKKPQNLLAHVHNSKSTTKEKTFLNLTFTYAVTKLSSSGLLIYIRSFPACFLQPPRISSNLLTDSWVARKQLKTSTTIPCNTFEQVVDRFLQYLATSYIDWTWVTLHYSLVMFHHYGFRILKNLGFSNLFQILVGRQIVGLGQIRAYQTLPWLCVLEVSLEFFGIISYSY